MSTVIMMFILPIGILVFFWDKKNHTQSIEVFRTYIIKMQHTELGAAAKMQRIDAMFHENGYKIIDHETTSLVAQKKHFNIGMLLIMFGLFNYFGIFGYVIFYRFFLKPRTLSVDITSDDPLTEG